MQDNNLQLMVLQNRCRFRGNEVLQMAKLLGHSFTAFITQHLIQNIASQNTFSTYTMGFSFVEIFLVRIHTSFDILQLLLVNNK